MLVAGETLLGYFVAMQGVDEVHLLNITVAPEFQGQGWSASCSMRSHYGPVVATPSGCG